MTVDVLEAQVAPCGECGSDLHPAGWSPLWRQYLCFVCLTGRTDAELRRTLVRRNADERILLKNAKLA